MQPCWPVASNAKSTLAKSVMPVTYTMPPATVGGATNPAPRRAVQRGWHVGGLPLHPVPAASKAESTPSSNCPWATYTTPPATAEIPGPPSWSPGPSSTCARHRGRHSFGDPPQLAMPWASYTERKPSSRCAYTRPPATMGGPVPSPQWASGTVLGVDQASLSAATLLVPITVSPGDVPVCAAPDRYMVQSHPPSSTADTSTVKASATRLCELRCATWSPIVRAHARTEPEHSQPSRSSHIGRFTANYGPRH